MSPSRKQSKDASEHGRSVEASPASGYDKLRQRAREAGAEESRRRIQRFWPALPAAVAMAGIAYLFLAGGTELEHEPAPVVALPGAEAEAAPPAAPAPEVVQPLSEHLAVVASPLADFRFAKMSSPVRSIIGLEKGSITARRLPGGVAPFEIHARGISVTARSATVSVFCCDRGVPAVLVHEGDVVVRRSGEETRLEAGAAWPEPSSGPPRAVLESAAIELRAWQQPGAARAAGSSGAGSQAERWRTARRLRVEGELGESLALFESLAGDADEVWAPLALFEAIRVHTAVADFEAVVSSADVFAQRYPDHELSAEVKRLACNGQKATGVELTACPE